MFACIGRMIEIHTQLRKLDNLNNKMNNKMKSTTFIN